MSAISLANHEQKLQELSQTLARLKYEIECSIQNVQRDMDSLQERVT